MGTHQKEEKNYGLFEKMSLKPYFSPYAEPDHHSCIFTSNAFSCRMFFNTSKSNIILKFACIYNHINKVHIIVHNLHANISFFIFIQLIPFQLMVII